MTYTPTTANRFRRESGTITQKLITEFGVIKTELDTYMVKTDPPATMKKVTNLYYDPATGELKFTAEA